MYYSTYALQFIGTKQGSYKHHKIIDGYNEIRPLPRGYLVQYNDNWCATFVSYVLHMCGGINAPYECSCYYMMQKAKLNNQIVKTPKVNDLVMYNWNGDSVPDHVGIITKITGDVLTVVEGNHNRSVGTRIIRKNSTYIMCFIRVKQAETSTKKDLTKVARDVIAGKYGNGNVRKEKLKKAGYDPAAVQKIVNSLLH